MKQQNRKTHHENTKGRKDESTKEEVVCKKMVLFRAFVVTPVFSLSLDFPCAEYTCLFHCPDLLFTDHC
jgi:hypothetical protein